MKSSKTKIFKTISLFSGCGGLDLGFKGDFTSLGKYYHKQNFELIWANDIDKNACLTFKNNFREDIVCADIEDVLGGRNNAQIPEKADIVLGGFPCQDFSVAGKRRGFNSKRGNLYKSMKKVVDSTRPLLFVAENVKGLLSMNNGDAIETIKSDFKELGYNVEYKLFHVANFGVPQNRERVLIVGTSKDRGLPTFEFPKGVIDETSWISVGSAISDLVDLPEGSVSNHYWSKAKMFKGTQGNSIIDRNKIAPTMRAEHHGNIEWIWNGRRRLSAREAARIQTFPDNFIFYPSTSSAYKQIGNAVPPVFAWHIAQSIEHFLNKYYE